SLGISSGNSSVSGPDGEKNIELHSFMVVRHGNCAAKGWWKPYARSLRTAVFFGGTLTATAIGFCDGKNPVTGGAVSGSFPGFFRKNRQKICRRSPSGICDHEGCGHETEIDI
ncbi:MAG: hypothetical protein ACLU3U_02585, partial [Gallintestinimicrobium sp.]